MLSAFILINALYVSFIIWLIVFLSIQKESLMKAESDDVEPLTLIIPVRNELDNLRSLFDSIETLVKVFKNLEVLIIDDNSNDGSSVLLKEWDEVLDGKWKIRLLYLNDGRPSKKKAIKKGLEQSTSDWIVQSDADCDLSINWLNSLREIDKSKLSFIAGPVAFKSNDFWTAFLKVESWALIAISYLGFKTKEPQMCSAANMCWDKTKLINEDYSEIINMDIPSGDDAYLLQYFKSKNVETMKYNWSKDSIIWTNAPNTFAGFINQRIRWASKWGAIKGLSQIFFPIALWLYHLLHITFLIFLISKGFYLVVFSVLFVKAVLEMAMLKKIANNFDESVSPIHVLFMQLLYSPYVVILGLLSQIVKYNWK